MQQPAIQGTWSSLARLFMTSKVSWKFTTWMGKSRVFPFFGQICVFFCFFGGTYWNMLGHFHTSYFKTQAFWGEILPFLESLQNNLLKFTKTTLPPPSLRMIHSQLPLSTFQCSTKQRLRFRELVTCLHRERWKLGWVCWQSSFGWKKMVPRNIGNNNHSSPIPRWWWDLEIPKYQNLRDERRWTTHLGGKGFPRNGRHKLRGSGLLWVQDKTSRHNSMKFVVKVGIGKGLEHTLTDRIKKKNDVPKLYLPSVHFCWNNSCLRQVNVWT